MNKSKRTRKYLLLCLIAIAVASFLRWGVGHVVREWLTKLIGADARGVIEHFLTGIGIPFAVGAALLIGWWLLEKARQKICYNSLVEMTDTTLDSFMEKSAIYQVAATFAVLYFGLTFYHEFVQAYRSVYGGPARGYMQWCQVAADLVGCFLSFLLARRFVQNANSKTIRRHS